LIVFIKRIKYSCIWNSQEDSNIQGFSSDAQIFAAPHEYLIELIPKVSVGFGDGSGFWISGYIKNSM